MKRRPLLAIIIGAFVVLCLCAVLSIALAPGSTPANTSAPTPTAQLAPSPNAAPTSEIVATPFGFITRETFTPWPFTTDGGIVLCTEERHILFVDAGVRYAVNGTALDAMKAGAPYKDVSEIWIDDPSAGAKVSLQPVIDIGLELCKQRD